MEVTMSEIANIPSAKEANNNRSKWKNLNIIICGICSEYALNVLKINNGEETYNRIKAYYKDSSISSKELASYFEKNSEYQELLKNIDISDTTSASYSHILGEIRWSFEDGINAFTISGYSFKSPSTLLKPYVCDGKLYILSYDEDNEKPIFRSLINGIDSIYYSEKAENAFICRSCSVLTENKKQITDESFFTLTDDLRAADDDQRKAISADTKKNLLVVAGAGSGKTRSLVGRVSYLNLVRGVPLDRILLLTFTKEATASMRDLAVHQIKEARIKYGFDDGCTPYVTARTFDSFFKMLIEEEWACIGFTHKPDFIYGNTGDDEARRKSILGQVIDKHHFESVLSDSVDFWGLFRNLENCANGIYTSIPGIEFLFDNYVEKQFELCVSLGYVYTAAIIERALREKDSKLYKVICDKYDCILIDEFQDISKLHNKIFRHLYSSNIHFTLVGDDDQAIYGWRGSDSAIMKGVKNDTDRFDVIPLTTNYRNNPYIVNAGNDILTTLQGRAKEGIAIKAYKKTGSPVHIAVCDSDFMNLAHEIKRIYETNDGNNRICILCRTMNDTKTWSGTVESDARKIKRALNLENVPSIIIDSKETEASSGYRVLKSLINILNKNKVRSSKREIQNIVGITVDDDKFKEIIYGHIDSDEMMVGLDSGDGTINLYHVAKLAESINLGTRYASGFADVVLNYIRAYERLVKNNGLECDDYTKLFYDFVENAEYPYPLTKKAVDDIFAKFEEKINATSKPTKDHSGNSVTIKTMHSAKGLEYNTVFVVGLNDGQYPNTNLIDRRFKRNKDELKILSMSKNLLDQIVAQIDDNVINSMIVDCDAEGLPQQYAEGLHSMKNIILENKSDLVRLKKDGVEAYLDGFSYIDDHGYRQRIIGVNDEIKLINEQYDEIYDSLFSLDSNAPEYALQYAKYCEIESIRKTKLNELEIAKKERGNYLAKISHLVAFRNTCLKAMRYMADLERARESEKIIKRLENDRKNQINEEKRLFYVSVSRAIDNLYLCYDKTPSEFIKLIDSKNTDNYVMQSKEQDDETKRLKSFIDESRNIIRKEAVDVKKADVAINRLIENTDSGFLDKYVSKFTEEHKEFKTIPESSRYYFEKAIQLIGLSEKLGCNFNIEVMFNLERFTEMYVRSKIGDRAVPLITDEQSATDIANDIRAILREKCAIERVPSLSYFIGLFSDDNQYNKLSNFKNLIFECYVICSDIYDVSEEIVGTYDIDTIESADEFLCSAIDVINMRNEMLHNDDEPWKNDYIPLAFEKIGVMMRELS